MMESVAFSLSNDAGIKSVSIETMETIGAVTPMGIISWEHCPTVATEQTVYLYRNYWHCL